MQGDHLQTKSTEKKDSTDLALFVRTSAHDIVAWDRKRIVDALIRETSLDAELAEEIGLEVEDQIAKLNIGTLTAPLVRELV